MADSLAQRRELPLDNLSLPSPSPSPSLSDNMKRTTADSAPSQPTDVSSGEEDLLYADRHDAQSFIQPAMSPIATRLTSPRTPAAEKAAAMGTLHGSYFDGASASKFDDGPAPEDLPRKQAQSSSRSGSRVPSAAVIPAPKPKSPRLHLTELPSPWTSTSKKGAVDDSQVARSNFSSVFGQSSHRRSSSGGIEALRRLSKALPSISLPSNLVPNRLPTPSSFFSSSSSNSKSDSKEVTPKPSPPSQSPKLDSSHHTNTFPREAQHNLSPHHNTSNGTGLARRTSALRRSTSNDSLLYHSLSRVSSFGDDDRFGHIRDQVNSRFKALVDSFDTPSFKLPNNLRSPLKSKFSVAEIESTPSGIPSLKTRDSMSPLDSIVDSLVGDVVIMGGYRGSILRSAEPPHRQLWVPVKLGLNIRKVNLEVGLDPKDEEEMENTIIPSGMLQNIGPVDISKRLFKKLRECENARTGKLRVHDYGYDWRLSPHLLSRKLNEFLKALPSNQGDKPTGALVIAHSLGGLITRHAVNQQPQLYSGVIYAGSPQRCINILGPLRNGDAVLLNEKVLTAQVHFSLRTTFIFLPEDGFCFVDKFTNEEYRVDWYDANNWVKHRISPCVSELALPPFSSKKANGPLGTLRNLQDSLSRGRSSSDPAARSPTRRNNPILKDRTLAPQMDSSSSKDNHNNDSSASSCCPNPMSSRGRNLAYLTRTLAEIKRFRAEMQHNPEHQASNAYPPIAVIYGKDTPTVYAARVASREGIACTDAYDDLVFRSGDGVVLAREAMPPPGYEIARDGIISTDRGHVTMLGDLPAVAKALEAIVKGRRKGIGMGKDAQRST